MHYEIALFRRVSKTLCELIWDGPLLPEDLEDLGVVGRGRADCSLTSWVPRSMQI
jgi:hypothetical protein